MFAGCRCPRCADSVLVVRKVAGRKVLGCKGCCGAFLGAAFGLRLLAVLAPDVPPPRDGINSPACPVCRQPMRRVIASGIEVETCKTHGVWFDAGDLPTLVRAVAAVMGKPVPASLDALEVRTRPTEAATTSQPSSAPTQPRRPYARTTGERVLDAVDAVTSPVDRAVDVVLFPFEVVGILGDLAGELLD